MSPPNRTYRQIGDNGYAQVDELYATGNIRGPGAPATFVDGDPNGLVSGTLGQLAIDRTTSDVYQNTDDAFTWALVLFGGGGGTVQTEQPLTGDGSPGAPVTYELIDPGTLLGNNNEIADKPRDLTVAQVLAMLTPGLRGLYLGRQRFTASGDYVPTPGTRRVRVRMVGGGGGSGGLQQSGADWTQTGGGCSGAYWERTFDFGGVEVTGGALVIGAAGAAGAAGPNAGGAGGNTTVTIQGVVYTAGGGGGGQGTDGTAGNGNSDGGQIAAGSSAADVTFQEPGESVANKISSALFGGYVYAQGGRGGGTPFGRGGRGATNNSGGFNNTVAPTGFGAGGGGLAQSPGAGTFAGRAGTAGLVIIDEFT